MPDARDIDLLQDYSRRGSEEAFAELVQRHINLVYSASLRHAGIAAHAEEITQAVFVILARKAASLRPDIILEAWLYETTRLTTLSFLRGERRRQSREQEAYMQSTLHEAADISTWNQLAPVLDEAMARLGKKDREALVLRFFKEKSLGEVAVALNITEAAAQSRVHRAVEKLRRIFTRRGIVVSATILSAAISTHVVQAAPMKLAKAATAIALVKGAAATGSTFTLARVTLKLMAWAKAKMAMAVGACMLLAVGTTTVVTTTVVKNSRPLPADEIYEKLWAASAGPDPDLNAFVSLLKQAPPALIVRPTHYANSGGGAWGLDTSKGAVANASLPLLIEIAYNYKQRRMILPETLPAGNYDMLGTLSDNKNAAALREEIKKQFGLIAHSEIRETNVLRLTVKSSARLQSNLSQERSAAEFSGYITDDKKRIVNFPIKNARLDDVARNLGDAMGIPITDHSGLTNRYTFNFQWNTTFPMERVRQSLRGQLLQFGLELKPGYEPIDLLVVEKVK